MAYTRLVSAWRKGFLRGLYGVWLDAVGIMRESMTMSSDQGGIGYLGPEGTFTYEAAQRAFGPDANYVPCGSIDGIFEAVRSGSVSEGVVPVENSTDGCVRQSLDGFVGSDIVIRGEVVLLVRQCLVSQERELEGIERVLSHPQGLGQCRKWLQAHLPGVPLEAVSSTGAAAHRAACEPGVAAIGSRATLSVFDLNLLVPDIHDDEHNRTRFWVIGRAATDPSDERAVPKAARDPRRPPCAGGTHGVSADR